MILLKSETKKRYLNKFDEVLYHANKNDELGENRIGTLPAGEVIEFPETDNPRPESYAKSDENIYFVIDSEGIIRYADSTGVISYKYVKERQNLGELAEADEDSVRYTEVISFLGQFMFETDHITSGIFLEERELNSALKFKTLIYNKMISNRRTKNPSSFNTMPNLYQYTDSLKQILAEADKHDTYWQENKKEISDMFAKYGIEVI